MLAANGSPSFTKIIGSPGSNDIGATCSVGNLSRSSASSGIPAYFEHLYTYAADDEVTSHGISGTVDAETRVGVAPQYSYLRLLIRFPGNDRAKQCTPRAKSLDTVSQVGS
jgi:hypothetical protein